MKKFLLIIACVMSVVNAFSQNDVVTYTVKRTTVNVSVVDANVRKVNREWKRNEEFVKKMDNIIPSTSKDAFKVEKIYIPQVKETIVCITDKNNGKKIMFNSKETSRIVRFLEKAKQSLESKTVQSFNIHTHLASSINNDPCTIRFKYESSFKYTVCKGYVAIFYNIDKYESLYRSTETKHGCFFYGNARELDELIATIQNPQRPML